jgi:hypothetical protein
MGNDTVFFDLAARGHRRHRVNRDFRIFFLPVNLSIFDLACDLYLSASLHSLFPHRPRFLFTVNGVP